MTPREHGLPPVACDDHDRERVRVDGIGRELGGKVAGEREPGVGTVGITGIRLCDIGPRNARGGEKFPRVEAHFDGGNTGAIECPAVDRDCRPDDRVA